MEQQVENGASPKAKTRASRKRSSQGSVLAIGDRVTVLQFQENGVIRFIGSTKFSDGEWVGVELDTPTGKNSGAVRGTHYFKCRENHGVFARKAGMQQVAGPSQDAAETPAAVAGKDGTAERQKNGLKTKPAGRRVSTRSVTSDKQAAEDQLQGAIEKRSVGEMRVSLQVAVNAGASQDIIQNAREMIHFQSQQEVLQQLTSVRSSLLKLSETVKSAEERATRLEKAATANREIVASESAHSSIKNWMFQCVDRIEQRVWLSVEARVEEKVRSAIDRAMAPEANGAQTKTNGSSSASQAPKAGLGLASADLQAQPSEEVQAQAQFWNDALQHKARHDIKAALQSGNLKQSLKLQSLRRQPQADATSEVQEVSVKAYEVMTKAVSSGELGAAMDKQATQRSPSAASDSVVVLRGLAAAANAVTDNRPKVAAGLAVAAASVAQAMPREASGRTLPNASVAVGLATAANRAASQASPDTAKLISFAVTAALAAGGVPIQKEETVVHSIAGARRTVCEGLLQASQAGLLQELVLKTVQQSPPQLSKLEIIDHLRRRAVADLSAASRDGRLKERLIAEAHLCDQSEKLGWFGV